MTTSILNDVKQTLSLLPEQTAFDTDITMHINSVFTSLTQLGLGPSDGYMILNKDNTWDEFTTNIKLNAVKSYMFLRVKLLFDPPQVGFVLTAMDNQIKELEWRLNVVADYG